MPSWSLNWEVDGKRVEELDGRVLTREYRLKMEELASKKIPEFKRCSTFACAGKLKEMLYELAGFWESVEERM